MIIFAFPSASLNNPQQDSRTQYWALFGLQRSVCLGVCVRERVSTSTQSPPQTRLTGQIAIYLQSAGSAHSGSLISRRQAASHPMKGRRRIWKVLLFWCVAASCRRTSTTMSSYSYSRPLFAAVPSAATELKALTGMRRNTRTRTEPACECAPLHPDSACWTHFHPVL